MYDLKVTRFANAPVISAGVMIANIIWYAQKTIIGIEGLISDGVSKVMPRRNAQWKLPRMPKKSVPLFMSPLKQSNMKAVFPVSMVRGGIEVSPWGWRSENCLRNASASYAFRVC